MSFGFTAYDSYVRIRSESDKRTFPSWESLSHVRRLAWEAAAQAVARVVLPNPREHNEDDPDLLDDDLLNDVDLLDEID